MKISLPSQRQHDIVLQSAIGIRERTVQITDEIERKTPVEFVEGARYIPASVSPFPGYFNMELTPYWEEILNCFDQDSPVREVIVLKGQGVGYTTNLENFVYYFIGHVKTLPILYVTADKDLSSIRMENNFLPMFQYSNMMDLFVSHDEGNTRKQGIKKNSLQWVGGGYMLPFGAQNADKARQQQIPNVLLDEVDGWPMQAPDGSDMVEIFKARGSVFWNTRKIFIGSTPLELESSRIEREYARGDQRKYMCRCLKCGYPQELRWSGYNQDTGEVFGFRWDMKETGELDIDSVRYHCQNTGCGHPHQEFDKPKFFAKSNAFWEPTETASEPNVRSYHLPGFFSMSGMIPWYKGVAQWLAAWDVKNNRVKDVKKLQVFYNNILGRGFDKGGSEVKERHASMHRRMWYSKGAIVNGRISEYCDSPILFLTCTVDVHKQNLAVAVWGWTANMTCWLIDYKRIEDNSEAGFEDADSPGWRELSAIIEGARWKSDDEKEYWIAMTLIDTGWNGTVVTDFCAQYQEGVIPIVGRTMSSKAQKIEEFGEYTTKAGTIGYRINVDHYKDRIAPVLRREWEPTMGKQLPYTFNAPVDITQKEIKELTAEKRRDKEWPDGTVTYYWHRPHGVPNELWDLMVYGHASVEIIAWRICIKHFKLDTVDWSQFWEFLKQPGMFFSAA
jgi:phage terminase large subunit GpA-like protein